MWLWLDKNKLLLNHKDLEKNNKETLKSLQLFNNKDNKEELQTSKEDNKLPKEPNNINPNIKPHKEHKLTQEDKPNYQVKSLSQLNQDLPLSSEFEVLLS